jgi:hypothetical protein
MKQWEIGQIKYHLQQIVRSEHPITVRGAFYRAVSQGLFSSTAEDEYRRCARYLLQMREGGALDDEMFIDTMRIRHESVGVGDVDEYIRMIGENYARNAWLDQPIHLELFSEKDAMTTILKPITDKYNVPFNIIRGNSSRTFLYNITEVWKEIDKPIVALYIGDHDPTGINIPRNTLKRLRELMDDPRGERCTMYREAALFEDMQRLPHLTIPIKESDKLAWSYEAEFSTTRALEVDAIPSDEIRDRLEKAILEWIDKEKWDQTMKEQAEEKSKLLQLNYYLRFLGLDQAIEALSDTA